MTGTNPLAGGLIGQLAVARGLITPEQLRQCLELHGRNGGAQRLGDLLVMQGLISAQQLQALLAEQTAVQQQQRQAGPAGGKLGDAADLAVVQGLAVGKVSVARKSPAEIEAEKKRLRASGNRPADTDGGIDLDLSSEAGEFEIESGGATRTIDTPAHGTKIPVAAAHKAPSQTPWGDDGLDLAAGKEAPAKAVAAKAPVRTTGTHYDPLATPGGKTIAELVVAAARAMASDLHLHTGYPLVI